MPVPTEIKLAPAILDLKSLEQKPTRDGYGLRLVQSGDTGPKAVEPQRFSC